MRALQVLPCILLATLASGAWADPEPDPEREREILLAESDEETTDGDVHQGGRIQVKDQRLRPVEIFRDTAVEEEWITEEQIQKLPARNAADVIQNLAGIRTTRRIQGEESAVSIEGMPVEYTRILVDGRRWSGELGGVDDLRDVSLENVERIEILRGAQGVRFGTDAAGGVINVVTKQAPERGARLSGDFGGGDDDAWLGSGTAAFRVRDLGVSLSAEHDQIDHFDDDEGVSTLAGEDGQRVARFVRGKLDLPVSSDVTLRANARFRQEHEDFVPEDLADPPTLRRDADTWSGGLGFDWTLGEATTAVGAVDYFDRSTDSGVGRPFLLDEDEWAADLNLDHFLETGPISHLVSAGIDLDVQRLQLDEGELPPNIENEELEEGRRVSDRFVMPNLFLQSETAVTRWLTIVAGGRARFHDEYPARLLPQVALLVRPLENLKLRASWGRNYRTPSLRDLYQPPTPQLGGAYFLAGREDLDPEESTSWRLGFEWSPFDWVSLSSTGFYNDIDDHIRSAEDEEYGNGNGVFIGTDVRLVPPPPPAPDIATICEAQALYYPEEEWTPECVALASQMPVEEEFDRYATLYRKTNLDSVRTWGLESQLRLRLGEHGAISFNHTWMETRVDDANVLVDELPNSPEHAVTGQLSLTSPWTETGFTTVGRWRSGVLPEGSGTGSLSFIDSSDRTDGSFQVDLGLSQPVGERVTLYADLQNVTDERRVDSYAVRGRTFFVGIRGTFDWGTE